MKDEGQNAAARNQVVIHASVCRRNRQNVDATPGASCCAIYRNARYSVRRPQARGSGQQSATAPRPTHAQLQPLPFCERRRKLPGPATTAPRQYSLMPTLMFSKLFQLSPFFHAFSFLSSRKKSARADTRTKRQTPARLPRGKRVRTRDATQEVHAKARRSAARCFF